MGCKRCGKKKGKSATGGRFICKICGGKLHLRDDAKKKFIERGGVCEPCYGKYKQTKKVMDGAKNESGNNKTGTTSS